NMTKFTVAYFRVNVPKQSRELSRKLRDRWKEQKPRIITAMKKTAAAKDDGVLYELTADELQLDEQNVGTVDFASFCQSMLRLFHNIRAALHVPDEPPKAAMPSSGPGRNDAFGLLSAALFGQPQPYAPVKYGLVWDVGKRDWVHWDGNTRSPLG